MVDRAPCRAFVDYHMDWTLTTLSKGTLVSGSADNTIKVWDESSGAVQRNMTGHGGEVTGLAVLESGFLVSASKDKTIKVWNQLTGRLKTTLVGHMNKVNGRLVFWLWFYVASFFYYQS